jgi:hypothetical protein
MNDKPAARPLRCRVRGAVPQPERQVAFRLGISAESRAAAFLIAKGFRILARPGRARWARSTSSRADGISWCSWK